MLRAKWEEVPLGSLRHYRDALQRYKKKAEERGFDYTKPTVIQVEAYLASTRQRCTVAPSKEAAALAWIENAFGVCLHISAN